MSRADRNTRCGLCGCFKGKSDDQSQVRTTAAGGRGSAVGVIQEVDLLDLHPQTKERVRDEITH